MSRPSSPGPSPKNRSPAFRLFLLLAAVVVAGVVIWQAIASGGNPDPLHHRMESTAAALDIGVLVFREGLESVLVLAAIVASMVGASERYRRPVAMGVVLAMAATVLTWKVAVEILSALSESIPALHIQAATGLLAIIVLLIVMNWFFHKIYWTGWITLHTRRRKALFRDADRSGSKVLVGLVLLGFTSFYREGFEVVLFLQSYRLKLGSDLVLQGVLAGSVLTAVVAILTFVANHRLPYRKMLVSTGIMLGFVLLVMVGEQVQEMQLAGWLSATQIPWLARWLPAWSELWLGLSPTVEGILAQLLAGGVVIGSYLTIERKLKRRARQNSRATLRRHALVQQESHV